MIRKTTPIDAGIESERDFERAERSRIRPGLTCPRCKRDNSQLGDFCVHCGFSFRATAAEREDAANDPMIGRIVNEKYRVLSRLGEGGFGAVYEVEHLVFGNGNVFALKVLHPSLSQDQQFRRRFLREAELAMSLVHENTIQLREFGEMPEGSLFYTMDYCSGEPLKQVLAKEQYLTVNRALAITRQILSVMEQAHALEIIHRDIKPENVFLEHRSSRDFVKVGDFGLAKRLEGSETGNISRGAILGTPRYMSPEQAKGAENLDERSDLYSIGVVLYEMLYGCVPAEVEPKGDRGRKSELVPPDPAPHPVPEAVWRVTARALRTRREDRYRSAAEFRDAIDALPTFTPRYSSPESAWRFGQKLFAAGLVLAAVAGGIWLFAPETWRWLGDGLRAMVAVAPAGEPGSAPPLERRSSAPDVPVEAEPAFFEEDVRTFVPYVPGDVLSFVTFRDGVHQSEYTYTVLAEESPGELTVKIDPGNRVVIWTIDDAEKSFATTFRILNVESGHVSEAVRRLELKLPARFEEDQYVFEGRFVDRQPQDVVDLRGRREVRTLAEIDRGFRAGLLPSHPRCLVVEFFETENRKHRQYYAPKLGLVASEVIDVLPTKGGETGERAIVFARYLVAKDHETPPPKPAPPGGLSGSATLDTPEEPTEPEFTAPPAPGALETETESGEADAPETASRASAVWRPAHRRS